LLNFPESKQIFFASNLYSTVDSTNNAPKYYDLGRWNISKDAHQEVEKLCTAPSICPSSWAAVLSVSSEAMEK
jgi:hypothetical protein